VDLATLDLAFLAGIGGFFAVTWLSSSSAARSVAMGVLEAIGAALAVGLLVTCWWRCAGSSDINGMLSSRSTLPQ
jgi:hypothetical protein